MSRMTLSTFLGTLLVFLEMSAYQAAASPLISYTLDSTKVAREVHGNPASGPGFHWGSAVAPGVGTSAFASRPTDAVSTEAAVGANPGLAPSDLTPSQPTSVDASMPSSGSGSQGSVSGLGQASEPPAEAASRASPIGPGTVAAGARSITPRLGDHSGRLEGSDTSSARAGLAAAAVGASGSTSPPRATLDSATGASQSLVAAGVAPAPTTVAAQTLAATTTPPTVSINSSPPQATSAGTTASSGTASAATTASLASIAFSNPPGQVSSTNVPSANASGPAGTTSINPGTPAAAGSSTTTGPSAISGNGPVAANIPSTSLVSPVAGLTSSQANHLPLSLVPLSSNPSSTLGGTSDSGLAPNPASDPVSTISALTAFSTVGGPALPTAAASTASSASGLPVPAVAVTDQVLGYNAPTATGALTAGSATVPLPASIPEPSVLSMAELFLLGLALKYLPRWCRLAARGASMAAHSPS
jgi:hypothetical protein